MSSLTNICILSNLLLFAQAGALYASLAFSPSPRHMTKTFAPNLNNVNNAGQFTRRTRCMLLKHQTNNQPSGQNNDLHIYSIFVVRVQTNGTIHVGARPGPKTLCVHYFFTLDQNNLRNSTQTDESRCMNFHFFCILLFGFSWLTK